MDISVYEDLKNGLKNYFKNLDISDTYKPTIVGVSPAHPKYPILIFDEVKNTTYGNYNNNRETIATLGYKVDVYAKDSGGVSKQEIARFIVQKADEYLSKYIGLKQLSFNPFDRIGDNGELYRIFVTYNTKFFEEKRIIYR